MAADDGIDFTPADDGVDFTPDPQQGAIASGFGALNANLSATAAPLVGAADTLGSMARGFGAQAYGGLAMGGKAITNALGITSGDPLDTAHAAEEAASGVLHPEPLTAAGQATTGAINKGMGAGEHAIERAEDYLDPSGNLKATAQDISERGNYVGAVAQAAAPLLHIPEATAPRGAPRPEPTAPKGDAGYTHEDFAPQPAPAAAPEAAGAANAPTPAPEAPARNPVPGKPHIRPKAVPAGEPTPAAPETPAAPSAAPDAAGNPPPDIHDPGFFPSPDNQDLKAAPAGPKEQATRQAAVERGAPTLPQVRDSAITNDYAAQGRDWTGKQAGDQTATAQINSEAQALHSEAARISGDTGGQLGTGESADTVRGKAYQDWHDTTVDALNKHINAAYAAEDQQAKQIATPGSNLKGVLTDDSLIDSADAGSARSSTIALGKKMGVDLTDPHAPMNAYQVENLRKHANSIYGNAPRFAQAIKNAADADLPAGAYQNARALRTLKGQMFDNRDGINQLGASKDIDPNTGKPRPENRPVKAADVMPKIESMDPDQVRHIMGTMKNSSTILDRLGDKGAAASITEKALKAAQHLQSHFTERWAEEAGKGGGWNQRRAHQFLRNNQETLSGVMSPEQMHQMRNVSNAANVLDLDKRYKGAFAQFSTGAHWLRQRLGRTAEGVITDLLPMGNTLGEMSGLSEKARNFLGGPTKGNPPKNFTRPLGAKMPGQRGAVGHLNAPGVVHDYEPSTGHHEVQSPNGVTHANDHPNGKDIVIDNTKTLPEGQGTGEGTLRVKKLADAAAERGGKLLSDSVVSSDQQRVYSSLAKGGYKVTRNPDAVYGTMGEDAKTLHTPDRGDHVFSVERPSITGSPQAGATSETPLGLRPGFRRQAGAVGDLGNPYNSAPAKKDVWGNERNVKDRTGAPESMRDYKQSLRDFDWGNENVKNNRLPQKEARTGNPYDSGGGKPLGQRAFGGKQRGAVGNLNRVKAADETPLAGAPEGDRPNGIARASAQAYQRQHGLGTQLEDYRYVQPEAAKAVADAYDKMKHNPSDPKVAAAYDAFKKETLEQYKHIQKTAGTKFTLDKDYPYKQPREAQEDVRENNHMSVYPTSEGFGTEGAAPTDNPMMEKSPVKMGGQPATYNDLFRAVHDYYGHVAEGNGFRANGEYNAWRAHREMYSDAARPAMDSETLGQNSWVNSGPHAEANRGASGANTVYADQKAGLLPKNVVDKAAGGLSAEESAQSPQYKEVAQHLTDQERADIADRAPHHRAAAITNLLDAFHGSTSTEGTAAMALAGQAKKGWYKNSGKAISTVYGPDAPRFTALLAAMSPQTSVEMNFRNAAHVFKAWDEADRPTSHAAIQKLMEDNSLKNPDSKSKSNVLGAWVQNGIRALTSDAPEHEGFQLSGPKVNSFYQNLRDNVHEVTNDSWNAVGLHVPQEIFGGAYSKAPGDIFGKVGGKSPGYMGASAKVRSAASFLSKLTGETWTPHETQETLWSFTKTAMEYNENAAKQAKAAGLPKPAEKTIPDLIREGKINDDLIRSTPDFASLFAHAEHAGVFGTGKFAAGAKRLAEQTRRAPEPASPSEASKAAAKTLRPALLEQAERLEGVRQQRIADKAAGRKERQIGNIQVPF